MDTGQWPDPWYPPAGAHDHPAVDRLPQDGVGAAHVGRALWCDGGRLDPEATLPEGGGRLVHDLVAGLAAVGQRQVEVALGDLEADDILRQQPPGVQQQLLTGLVAVEDRHGRGHGRIIWFEFFGAVGESCYY